MTKVLTKMKQADIVVRVAGEKNPTNNNKKKNLKKLLTTYEQKC